MDATHYNSYTDAATSASADEILLPVAAVTQNGSTRYVIGVPSDTPVILENLSVSWQTAQIPPPPSNATLKGPVSMQTKQKFVGEQTTRTLLVSPYDSSDSIFPQTWYISKPSTVRSLGVTGGFVIDKSSAGTESSHLAPKTGTISPSISKYFVGGMEEVLRLLGLATIGGSVLILVVVYNVTRMSVRDRLQAIEVIRSTGGNPRHLHLIFGCRAGLLTATGIMLGYALGVLLTRGVINIAIVAGLPISLDPTVSTEVLKIILPCFVVLLFVGIAAGVLAVRPATLTPPARLRQKFSVMSGKSETDDSDSKILELANPTILKWRAFFPATTVLTIFILIIVLVGSLAGTLAPLATTASGTVTEPGAEYPMESRIDAGYANLLRSQGVAASPEIIIAQVRNGQPYLARGANYSSFATVSNATLTSGRTPNTKHEAVIGRDLAQTLDVNLGEQITLGGTTSPAFTQVTVVGMFTATGIQDDQLIVPLATAHDLSTKPGIVHFIRTDGTSPLLTDSAQSKPPKSIIDGVSAPSSIVAGQPLSVRVSVRNFGQAKQTRQVTASVGNTSRSHSVRLAPGEQRDVTINMTIDELGNHTLRVGTYSQSVTVYRHAPLTVQPLPATALPNAKMAIPVRTADGKNVSAATVQVSNYTTQTNKNGIAMIRLPNQEGVYNLTVQKGNRKNISQIRVTADAVRQPIATVDVSPKTASVFTQPTASVTIFNPWDRTVTREIAFVTPAKTITRRVTLKPFGMAKLSAELGDSTEKTLPGKYSVQVISGSQQLAADTYTVHGDDRLFSTLAQDTEYTSGSGLEQAIQGVFGNFNLLLLAMSVLAGMTAIGGTTATFAQAVHARRRALGVYRATGATRWQVLRPLIVDVFRISIPAISIALVVVLTIVRLLSYFELFTIFGFRLSTQIPFSTLFLAVGGALVLMCLSAIIAAVPYLLAQPATVQKGIGSQTIDTAGNETNSSQDAKVQFND
ncbi:FtsX-like permease family protein [Haladaptatus pallidirubidus]|uniref:FtsX-like permease family protein n=2 Tax=Haladaptatus pallidirubidus TaxID=1008152 RepID=UPI001D112738|nr:FtsX-like permease family protein [Haladaptatus pallidirubidus]